MNHVITVRNRVITLPNTLNLISHSQALDTISFDVDAEWNGFRKIAVFKAGHDAPVEVAVGTNVTIPAEVLRKTGYIVIGLYGTKDEKIMPTLWSDRICVDIGTDTDGVGATPATAPLYEQALTKAEQAVATVQTFDSRITSAQNAASAAQSAVASKADATTVSTLAQTVAGKADSTTVSALATTVSGKAEASAVSALATEVSEALAGKQDAINDLGAIRNGAALGATALQEHQSLAAYRTAAEQDAVHDASKQDVISDLSAIRSGASAGSTALQSVPNTYRTASAQDALIDSNFKTAATSATAPAFTNDEKAAACSRIGAVSVNYEVIHDETYSAEFYDKWIPISGNPKSVRLIIISPSASTASNVRAGIIIAGAQKASATFGAISTTGNVLSAEISRIHESGIYSFLGGIGSRQTWGIYDGAFNQIRILLDTSNVYFPAGTRVIIEKIY